MNDLLEKSIKGCYKNMIPSNTVTDYNKLHEMSSSQVNNASTMFIMECGIKLGIKSMTSCQAALLFHRVFRNLDKPEYDKFVVAASCIYLSGKVSNDTVKIRDLMNVSMNTLNKNSEPIPMGQEYWALRDSIVQMEMVIIRVLKFDLDPAPLPHIYLLHYIKTLSDWFPSKVWNVYPVAKTAFTMLQDFFHNPTILNFSPEQIGITCLILSLQIYGLKVPLSENEATTEEWFQTFVHDLTMDTVWEIIEQILQVYSAD